MLGLRGPRPVWQQEEVCGITRNRQISWPISTGRFKQVNMDRSEPSKAECWTCSSVIYLCGGAPGRPDWQACGSCHAPTWKGIAPTPQRCRSALIKRGKRLIPTGIDCSFFFFFLHDTENISWRNSISIRMEMWSIWNINKWSPCGLDHHWLICHSVKHHLKHFLCLPLSLSLHLSICPSYRTPSLFL